MTGGPVAAAIPWLLLAAVSVALIVAVVGLLLDRRDQRAAGAEIEDLVAANAELTRRCEAFGVDLARARRDLVRAIGERDLARNTVRELLDAQRAGHRYPRPQQLPMPPDVDQALTEKFTRIVERHRWPENPS